MCRGRVFAAHQQRGSATPPRRHRGATPFAKTRACDDIYLDRHRLVEIHLHDKICRLWTQKEKTALHLVSGPSDLSTAGVKDKELFIHNTLHRGGTCTRAEREGGGWVCGLETRGTEGKSQGVEGWGGGRRERKRVVNKTLYQGEDSARLIRRRRRGPGKIYGSQVAS